MQEDAVVVSNVKAVADLATKLRIPSAGFIEFAEAGGLIGYGARFEEMCRRAGFFVDAVLKGGRPAAIPVEQATRFEFILNMKTADALGRRLPALVSMRADRVIEQGLRVQVPDWL